jgi:hypothetical protein
MPAIGAATNKNDKRHGKGRDDSYSFHEWIVVAG